MKLEVISETFQKLNGSLSFSTDVEPTNVFGVLQEKHLNLHHNMDT